MLRKIINFFSKSGEDFEMVTQLPKGEQAKFVLKVDGITIGTLQCEEGVWFFMYSSDFENHIEKYNRIIGFPDLNKTYQSETLWPFFQIRIPGLKQPAIQEIIAKENIDKNNEVALLKRFGYKSISNPYELVMA